MSRMGRASGRRYAQPEQSFFTDPKDFWRSRIRADRRIAASLGNGIEQELSAQHSYRLFVARECRDDRSGPRLTEDGQIAEGEYGLA